MVISLVYHIFLGVNIQDYQHPGVSGSQNTHIKKMHVYIYKCVVYNYPSICTMRGLEHAGLDIWAVAHISHHLNRSVGALVFFCRASLPNSSCLTQKVQGAQDKSPSSTFHTVGRVWGMRSMEGIISRMIQAFGANPPQCPYWDRLGSIQNPRWMTVRHHGLSCSLDASEVWCSAAFASSNGCSCCAMGRPYGSLYSSNLTKCKCMWSPVLNLVPTIDMKL